MHIWFINLINGANEVRLKLNTYVTDKNLPLKTANIFFCGIRHKINAFQAYVSVRLYVVKKGKIN